MQLIESKSLRRKPLGKLKKLRKKLKGPKRKKKRNLSLRVRLSLR